MSSISQGSYTVRNLQGDEQGEHAYFRVWPKDDMYIEMVKKAEYGSPVTFEVGRPSDMSPGEFASEYLEELDSINPDCQVHFFDLDGENVEYTDLASIGESMRLEDRVIPSENIVSIYLPDERITWNEDMYGSASITCGFDSLDEDIKSFVIDEREDYDEQSIEPVTQSLKQEIESHNFDWRTKI